MGEDDVADLYLAVLPRTSQFGAALDRDLGPISTRSGTKVGRNLGTRIEAEAARTTSGRFLTNNPNLTRAAGQAGLRIGRQIATGVGKQMVSTIVSRAGTNLGNKLYEKAAERLRGSRWEAALKNPKILAAAGAVGLLVGRRLAARASAEARAGMKLEGIGARGAGALKTGLKGGLGGLGGLVAGIIGVGVIGGIKTAVDKAKELAQAASDFNETVSKGRTIFGSSSRSIERWASGAAASMGLATGAALEGASSFGNLFDQLGIGRTRSVQMSKGFVQMASDAASFNNADPSEVMDAFLSATRGEYDALQRFVPTVSAATIQTEALRATHKKSANDLTAADKATALYTVSVRDMGKAHGDFARTSGGFANQQRIMAANWQNLRVQIGQYFLPIFTRAAVYANTVGFPAFKRIVRVLGDAAESAGRMARAVLEVFTSGLATQIDQTTFSLTEIADWLETNQTTMVRFFIRLGDGAINFGQALSDLAAGGIRAFGRLSGGLASFIEGATPALQGVMEGLASVIEIFDHDAAEKIREGSRRLGEGGAAAAAGLRATQGRAEDAANAVQRKMNPIFEAARRKLHEVGQVEIWRAEQREAAILAARQIRDIGQKGDVTRNKLHGYNIESGKGTAAQRAFAERVHAARNRLIEQWRAGQEAGDKQATLTRRWDKGREALYREFRQMGFSKEEARKLAAQYGKVPKKVETRVSQPGMDAAHTKTKHLDNYINGLNGKSVEVEVRVNAELNKVNRALVKEYGKGALKMALATGGVMPGWSPGRDIHRFISPTGGQLDLSGGEAVMVPQWTRAVGGPRAVARMNAAARAGSFANGGVVARDIVIPTRLHGNTYDLPRMRDLAADASRDAYRTAVSDLGHMATSAAARAAVAAARSSRSSLGAEGYSGPLPGGRGAAGIRAIARALGASHIAPYRDPQGLPAFDLGSSGARNDRIARALISRHSALGLRYVIHQMEIASARSNWHERAYHPITNQGDFRHVGHVHVSYDRGGELPPGLTLAYNGTGRPETVVPAPRAGQSITILLDLGDGLRQRVEGIIDEANEFRASVGRSHG